MLRVCTSNRCFHFIIFPLHKQICIYFMRWVLLLALCVVIAVPTFVLKFTPAPTIKTNNGTVQEWWPITHGLSVADLLLFMFSSIIQVSYIRTMFMCTWCNLFLLLQVVVGYPFYKSCIKGLLHKSMGMDMLIAVATTVAYLYSVTALILNVATQWHFDLFFDSGPLLMLFITLGKLLERIAKVCVQQQYIIMHLRVTVVLMCVSVCLSLSASEGITQFYTETFFLFMTSGCVVDGLGATAAF